MSSDPLSDFMLNLAAGLTQTLLGAGVQRLRQAALGTDEDRALRAALEQGFATLLAEADAQLPDGALRQETARLVGDIFTAFVAAPEVADNLLAFALAGAPPDMPRLAATFAIMEYDRDTLPVDFERCLTAFHRGMTAALVASAMHADSPLFHQVSLGRTLAIQALLENQQRSLAAVAEQVRRLEAQGGQVVYNIVIERAIGPVAIGEYAQAGALSADVQALLAEVLDGLRRLPPVLPPPPAYTPDDLRVYLKNIVRVCSRLDLVGAGLPVNHLPLERVYVALKADRSSATERRANRLQLEADWAAMTQELDLRDLDERDKLRLQRRFLAGHDPIGLTLAFAQHQPAADRSTVDLGRLVATERWVVLLGDPGAGKTTLVRWLGLQHARALLAGQDRVLVAASDVQPDAPAQEGDKLDLGPALLPVLLRLADYERWRWDDSGYDTGRSLIDFLGRHPWLQQAVHPMAAVGHAIVLDFLRRGAALLLFDGLDEIVDPGRRGDVVTAVESFVRTWVRAPHSGFCPVDDGYSPLSWEQARPDCSGGNQVLITSRPIGYYLAPLAPAVPHYTVEEMGETAVRRFCRAWATAIQAERGQGDPKADAAALEAALLEQAVPGMREIVVNPLLLTILAGLYYTLEGPLPERRVQIYDAMATAFTRQRADAWRTAALSDERIRYALGYVAAQLHASATHPNGLVEEETLLEWLEEALEEYDGAYAPRQREQAQAILHAARSLGGFLLERGGTIYGFIHRTFQEYFAAHYLSADRKVAIARILAHLDDPAWQEVLVLAVAEAARLHPRQTTALLEAVQAASEPMLGLIPHHSLFLSRALAELPSTRIPAHVVRHAMAQLVAAYADRTWPPAESSRPSQPLRDAIATAVRRLQSVPGSVEGMGNCLTDARPEVRLAAAELILDTAWLDAGLVSSLLSAVRSYAEPAVMLREALLRHHMHTPYAFTAALIPAKELFANTALVAQRWQHEHWRVTLQLLYLCPKPNLDIPPAPADVMADSALTPLLRAAWQEDCPDARSVDWIADLIQTYRSGVHDALLVLAVQASEEEVEQAISPSDEAAPRGLIARLGWHLAGDLDSAGDFAVEVAHTLNLACDRARDRIGARDLAFDVALDLDRARDLIHDFVHDLVLTQDRHHSRDHNHDLARFGNLALARTRDRDLALASARDRELARDLDLARDRTRNLARDRDRDLANDRNRDPTHDRNRGLAHNRGLARNRSLARDLDRNRNRDRELARARERAREDLAAIIDLLGNVQQRLENTGSDVLSVDDLEQMVVNALQRCRQIAVLLDRWTIACQRLVKAVEKNGDTTGGRSSLNMRGDEQQQEDGASPRAFADGLRLDSVPLLLGERDAVAVTHVADSFAAADDLHRYWVRDVLAKERPASTWGREHLETLAELAASSEQGDDSYLAVTAYDWALRSVRHDRCEWLTEWAVRLHAGEYYLARLLRSIHRLANEAWPLFCALLRDSPPPVQVLLLESTSWLLRLSHPPESVVEQLCQLLLSLSEAPNPVGSTALEALGYTPPAEVNAEILLARLPFAEDSPGWITLARLSKVVKTECQATIDVVLASAPPGPAVDAALARTIIDRRRRFDPYAVVAALATLRPNAQSQLAALLAAGSDDDSWNAHYHGRVAHCVSHLVQQQPMCLLQLLSILQESLAANRWAQHRIALAALAELGASAPGFLNQAGVSLTHLLHEASRSSASIDSRRFAITALSYLREITPEVIDALLHLAGDESVVQQDAIAAASRFNRLHPSLGDTLPSQLIDALCGHSGIRAYVSVKVQEALGTSTAIRAAPALRKQITNTLVDALSDGRCQRPVWLWKHGSIVREGTLDQHLYAALLRVAGYGGGIA